MSEPGSMSLQRFAALALLVLIVGGVIGWVAGMIFGDDGSSSSSPASVDTASSSRSGSATTQSSTGGNGSSTGSGGAAASSNLADLQKATRDLKAIDYRVTYDTSTTDPKGVTSTSSITLERKGTKSLVAFDGAFSGGTGASRATVIDDGTATYICTDNGQKMCLKTKSGGGTVNPIAGIADGYRPDLVVGAFSKDGSTVEKLPNQTIAGRDARCYLAKGPDGNATICLDARNGMLLLMDGSSTTNGQTTKTMLRAKQATDAPSDNDFTPPYPVQTIPGQ